MSHLNGLNERQKEAVLATEGPLLIIAGAGAGKTRVLTHRILHLIEKGVPAETILAITFTNKAAKEMLTRVHALMERDPALRRNERSPFISTFHALGAEMLRRDGARMGLPQRFTILDRDDSKRLVREAMQSIGVDPKQFEPGKMLAIIGKEKGDMVTEAEYAARTGGRYTAETVSAVWNEYERLKTREKSLDFDDLLLKPALLLAKNREVRAAYQNRFRYLHIDEYQDTNRVQYELARLLTGAEKNIAVVGDGDQNIYSWRGASVKNMMDFEKDYPEAKVVLLEENYRSTQKILAAANSVITKNTERHEKTLFTRNDEGEQIGLFVAADENDEAAFVASTSAELIAEGARPDEIAVLYRANFQSRALEEAMMHMGVPYQVLGTRFFERREVKDIVAYLRAALDSSNPADLKRVVEAPARGIGKVTLLKILAGREEELPAKMRERVAALRTLLEQIRKSANEQKLSETIRFIISASGIEREYKKNGEEGLERLENIRELVTFAAKYDALAPEEARERFLTDAALGSEQDELSREKTGVKLMTVHASKGLEFPFVFITGLEQGLFPHESGEPRDHEEERRLFYVALTRAEKKVFLTYAGVRTLFGARQVTLPSEFLSDIDEELLNVDGGGRKRVIYLD